MTAFTEHFRLVDRWVMQSLGRLEPDELIDAFHQVLTCIWSKAHLTLGGVTMQAITERVLHVAKQRYPWLTLLDANDKGVDLSKILHGEATVTGEELRLGLGFVTGELLTVIGAMSAEVISPKLHACLKRPITNDGKK